MKIHRQHPVQPKNVTSAVELLLTTSEPKTPSATKEDPIHSPPIKPRYANKQFDLYYPRKYPDDVEKTNKCSVTSDPLKCFEGLDQTPMLQIVDENRNPVLKTIKSIDEKLNSPQFKFLAAYQSNLSCSCEESKYPDSQCPYLPVKGDLGLYAISETYARARKCLPVCTPTCCRCGKDCPSKPGPFEKFPNRTFHVPDCPSDRPCKIQPRSPIDGLRACPFSPACCPIAEVCPFPVATMYDPNAPLLPTPTSARRCPLVPSTPSSPNMANPQGTSCPLDPLKSPGCLPSCPLTASAACPLGQSSGCPLLTCSLGSSLKTFIFEGNDECPFCKNTCCPMITPDGPGCPIAIAANFCPLDTSDICALKGKPFATSQKKEQSCLIGELLDANAAITTGCRCVDQHNTCPLIPVKSCPASSSLPPCSYYCASSSNIQYSPGKLPNPVSCPLRTMNIPRPLVAPCSLTPPTQLRNCPIMNVSGKKFDESCSLVTMFECPALKRQPHQLTNSIRNETMGVINQANSTNEELTSAMRNSSESTMVKTTKCYENKSPKVASLKKQKTNKNLPDSAIQHRGKEGVGKIENARKLSRASDGTQSITTNIDTVFDVTLPSLPHPPRSDSKLLKTSKSRKLRRFSPVREDASPFVQTADPSNSKDFLPQKGKPKPKNCPFSDPEPCPLELPKCPFGPPEPSCPLAKTPNCPLQQFQDYCTTGITFNPSKIECPVETNPCELFPSGHCPMENLNVCDCNYPVAPCMEPLIPDEDVFADEQYCSKLNCCMGLPLPPTKPSEEFETDTWYAFTDVKPGNPITKHHLEILDVPPDPQFFISMNQVRQHPGWKIIKRGEGYQECARIKRILAARGPTSTVATQFIEDELPDDEEIDIIEQNKKNAAGEIERIRLMQFPGWKD